MMAPRSENLHALKHRCLADAILPASKVTRPRSVRRIEVLMLGDWRAAAGEMGFWPECGHLARPTLGWKSQTGRPERKRFAFHTRSMGTARPGASCVGRPAPASARGHRPHPLDVQRQAHEVPLAAHLRQASQAESSESEHLLDPPVRRLREPLALRDRALPAGLASFSPMRCVAGSRAGSTATWDLLHAPALRARRCRDLPAPTDPARCSSPHRPVPPQARPQTSR